MEYREETAGIGQPVPVACSPSPPPDRNPVESGLRVMQMAIEILSVLPHIEHVKATTKRQVKTEAELLNQATNNLLRALKQDMREKDGGVDRGKLRKDGYSERLISRLEQA